MSEVVGIIVGQSVRTGQDQSFVEWQREAAAGAARFPGYLSSDLSPPGDGQPDWTAVYRFDSVANARHWLDSAARQDMLDRAAAIFAGPGTCQIITDGDQVDEPLVTVVVSHPVPSQRVDEFLAWQSRIADSQRNFPGFRGVEVFRPIEGVQEDWAICMKFDTAEHLDAWLNSAERQHFLRHSPFGDFTLRRIDNAFGNWFSLGDGQAPPPSNLKTSIAVWLGLYPTVMFLTLLLLPLHMPLWAELLVGNLLSSIVMSYLTMPYYSNRLLGWWLRPKTAAPQPRTNILGVVVVVAVNAAWAVFFLVLTERSMHLR